jgi:hypothetical protein
MLTGKYFRCVITNSVGSYVANSNSLLLGSAPGITVDPNTTPHTYTLASATALSLSGDYTPGDLAATIQWWFLKDGATSTLISGATTKNLTTALSSANGFVAGSSYQFYFILNNQRGNITSGLSGTYTLT